MFYEFDELDNENLDNEKVIKMYQDVTNNDIVERITSYNNTRYQGTIKDTHKRATYLVHQELLEKIASLEAFLEVYNGKESEVFNDTDKSMEKVVRDRGITKGFKTKLINTALDSFFKEWETVTGGTPDTEVIKFKADSKNKIYHKAYFFKLNDKYCYVRHDEDGKEIEHFLSPGKVEVLEKFERHRELEVKEGRPSKK